MPNSTYLTIRTSSEKKCTCKKKTPVFLHRGSFWPFNSPSCHTHGKKTGRKEERRMKTRVVLGDCNDVRVIIWLWVFVCFDFGHLGSNKVLSQGKMKVVDFFSVRALSVWQYCCMLGSFFWGRIFLDLSSLINVFSDGVLALDQKGFKMIRAPLSEFSSKLVGSFTWPAIGECLWITCRWVKPDAINYLGIRLDLAVLTDGWFMVVLS